MKPSASRVGGGSASSPKRRNKPIRIVLGGGKGGGGKKRKRPAVAAAQSNQQQQTSGNEAGKGGQHVPAIFKSLPKAGDSSNNSSEGKKQAANESSVDELFDPLPDDQLLMPCDTLLALRSIVSKGAAALCPLTHSPNSHYNASSSSGLPFALKPMLHHALLSSISSDANISSGAGGATNDNTQQISDTNRTLSAGASTGVNIELDELRQSNTIRLIQLHGTGDAENDLAVMESSVFEHGVRDAFFATRSNEHGSVLVGGLQQYSDQLSSWFLSHLPQWNNKFVLRESIRLALLEPTSNTSTTGGCGLPAACRDVTKVIDHLIGIGLLLPRNIGATSVRQLDMSYWFTLPCMGIAAKSIAEGRKRVLSKVRRSNYGEIKRAALEVGLLPSSKKGGAGHSLVRSDSSSVGMPAAFHIRDLLSRGDVKVRDTPAGQFIRIAAASAAAARKSKK